MPSDRAAFEERLKRIHESRHGQMPPAKAAKPPQRRGWLWPLSVMGLVALAAVFAASTQITAFPGLSMNAVTAALQGSPNAPAAPGVMAHITEALLPGFGDTGGDPVTYLPPAPEGWLRVTTQDVRNPDLRDVLAAHWPRDPGVLPLEQHPGHRYLDDLVSAYHEPGMEGRAMLLRKAFALYLHPNGEFLNVSLEFKGAKSALGPKDDTAGWTDALAAIEESDRASGEIVERIELAGQPATNRTQAKGDSLILRPINAGDDGRAGMRIAVALTDRAILRLHGISTPALAEALITATDRDALAARLGH